jgi:cellulose synthase/poly-beta-1,6-N-acetylglucosamine synthase-like glycosyltransferase
MFARLFWINFGTLFYTFLGYPVLASILARFLHKPLRKNPSTPAVTVVIPAFNEEAVIEAKIENCKALDYPGENLAIVIVADGSSDRTVELASKYPGVSVLFDPLRRGKAAAINQAMRHIQSDIVLFTDANSMLAPTSLRAMVANFADPTVGGVTGEKRVGGGGEGLYWRYESFIKKQDSQFGSVMGAAGEIFAIRTNAYLEIEEDSIIEDFVLSMRLVAAGWRVVYEPGAIAWEAPAPALADDFERRTRIAAGGIQSILRLPEMLDPKLGWPFWQYFSHRVLRWMVTPLLLPLLFLNNLLLLGRPFYRLMMAGQLFFYGSAIAGYYRGTSRRKAGFFSAITYFCMANLAAVSGIWRYFRGNQPVTWRKLRRDS